MKKKIGNQANMLVVEDLILAYNWGPAKDPAKTPPLTGLEDKKDYAGIHHYMDTILITFQGLQVGIFNSANKQRRIEDKTLRVHITVSPNALENADLGPSIGNNTLTRQVVILQ